MMSKKSLAIALLIISASMLVPAGLTHAQIIPPLGVGSAIKAALSNGQWFECSFATPLSWPTTCVMELVLSTIGLLAKFAIVVAAFVLEIILLANQNIVGTPSVQIGFNISLAVANLGFVLGIVIIAIATILRFQSYAMKQVLWKLVVAALLVNFSLPIAGTVVTFADGLGRYFMNASGNNDISSFVVSFAGSFGPQRAEGLPEGNAKLPDAVAGGVIEKFVAMFTATIMLIVIVISMGALVVMMGIRYVMLGILFILMPFVWLFWIFPATKNMWDKWWHAFIRWTFFFPVVMFFIYLALQTWLRRNEFINQKLIFEASKSGATAQLAFQNGFFAFIQSYIANFVNVLGEQVIILALMIGGLFAANKLSIMGAGAGLQMAKGASAAFGGYVGKTGRRMATAPLRGETGRAITKGLQQPRSLLGRIMAPVGGARLGRALQATATAGGEKEVAAQESRQKGMTTDQLINGLSTMNAPQRFAALKRIKEEKREDEIRNKEKYFGKDAKAEFARYNQGKLFKELRGSTGLSLKDLEEERKDSSIRRIRTRADAETHNKSTGENRRSEEEIEEEMRDVVVEHSKKLTKSLFPNMGKLAADVKKGLAAMPAGTKDVPELEKLQEIYARQFMKYSTAQSFSNAMKEINNADALDNFTDAVKRAGIKESEAHTSIPRWLDNSPGARDNGLDKKSFNW